MSGHTSGPWHFVADDDPRGQPSPFYRGLIAITERGDRHLSIVSDGREVPKETWEPNARLIAAAPDLYEVARDMCEAFANVPKAGLKDALLAVYDKARLALLKADGR